MELHNITSELRTAAERLRNSSSELFHLARERAEAEKNYRIALAREIVKLKDAGQSVTLISDIARGECADLKFQRDLSEARYSAGRELLQSLQTQVSALQTILKYQEEG
mgnify:CR=1 FL=1